MKTIFLSTGREEGVEVNYYITALDKPTYDEIDAASWSGKLTEISQKLGINCNNTTLVGVPETSKTGRFISTSVTKYLGSFEANTGGERQTHYRDYTKSWQKQKDNAWLINTCPDHRGSWTTLMMALNHPTYIIIWYDTPDKHYNHVRQFTEIDRHNYRRLQARN